MSLSAGNLRHRVTIQRPVESQDENTGAVDVVWQDVATVWASIEPLSVREFIAAQAEASKINTRIVIRYRADVSAKMRIYHAAKNVYYDIHGKMSDKESGLEYLTLPCSEGTRYQDGDPAHVAPDNLTTPEIFGTPVIDGIVMASNGLWANNPDAFSYQWYLDDEAIEGAVGQQIVVPDAPSGILTVGVVASSGGIDGEEAISAGVIIQ